MSNKPRRNHTKEFKEAAVKLVLEQGYLISEAARNLGVNPNLLSRWKRELEMHRGGHSKWLLFMAETREIASADRE